MKYSDNMHLFRLTAASCIPLCGSLKDDTKPEKSS